MYLHSVPPAARLTEHDRHVREVPSPPVWRPLASELVHALVVPWVVGRDEVRHRRRWFLRAVAALAFARVLFGAASWLCSSTCGEGSIRI
jgi:hypothetical protein